MAGHAEDSGKTAEQAERCWQLRLAGVTQREIARQEGISQQRVSQLLQMVRDQIPARNVDHLITEAVERYEALRRPFWELAQGGDKDAAEMVRKIDADHRKLLGLDQPSRVEQSTEIRYEIVGVPEEDV